MASQTLTLSTATASNIPTLCAISEQAFATDTHTLLKAASNPSDKTHGAEMENVFRSWMARPSGKCRVMKADMADGEVVGFAIWAFGGFEHVFEGEDVAAPAAPVIKKDQQQDQEGKEEEKEDEVQEESKTKTKIQELAEITNASMKEWQARLMPPGSRCIVLVAISVLPDYQGQGVGSALIKWGTEIADREGVYCWVSSSDKGWGAFQKMGFREVERLSINLDDFADEGIRNERREDGKWGDYTFHYMRREAGASHVGQLKR